MSWDNMASHNNYETPMNISGNSPDKRQDSFNTSYHSFHTPYKVEQLLNQFNQTQKQFDNRYLSAQAVEQQLAVILKTPSLSQRCLELNNLIKERFACNMARSILSQFKPIVENIFGLDAQTDSPETPHSSGGWNLRTLTRNFNSSDYDSVVSFLHPEGVLFALIKSLMTETSAKFEFPVTKFPTYFRSMIENGTAPPFFANKILSTSFVSASHLILNPFEFYIFHFGLYILNSSGSTYDNTGALSNEPAYFALLKTYLNHFVPLETVSRADQGSLFQNQVTNQQGSIWQSLSSTTSSILNLANINNQSSNTGSQSGLPSLFKATIFQPPAPFNRTTAQSYLSTPGPMLYGQGEHLGSIEWRCSTFLLMLTELWFGNIPAPKTNYILRSANFDELSVSNIQPYSANIDQMTSVRIVIKHLHSFSNTFTYNPLSHANSQGLAEIKQAIWTAKYPLQKRLYTFIKVAFNRWPMDYTFRQPLEAWLSYIQPWRYVKIESDGNDFEDIDGNRSTTLIDVPSIDNHWRNFISDNLLYYTVIFSLFVNRLLQLDLSSSRNALMLFRVIKVYSQPSFLILLRDAEEALLRNNLEQSMNVTATKSPFKTSTPNKAIDPNASKAKLLAPSFLASGRVSTPKTKIGALEHHLLNLESDSDFSYVSLFSPQMKQHLTTLLVAIQKSRVSIKDFCQSVDTRTEVRNRGWFDSIKSFISFDDARFESKDEREMYKDKKSAEGYLDFATNKITHCFDLQLPELDLTSRISNANLNATRNPSSQKIFFNY